jgi:hypothetical protein
MSVGDVVRADGQYYICAPSGWTAINEECFQEMAGLGFTQRHVLLSNPDLWLGFTRLCEQTSGESSGQRL